MFNHNDLQQEIIRRPWQDMPRGAKLRDLSAADVMVDIDEVIMATVDHIHEIAFERGLHDGSKPMSTWAGYEQYGCPPEVYWDLWSDFALSGGYLNSPPIPGAVEALRELYFEGHRIHLVTARGFMNHASDIRLWTPQWVEEFAVPWHTLSFAKDKVAVQHDLAIRFDYAIDDSPKNYEMLDSDGVNVYLQSHPHNATFDASRRVNAMQEFVDIILEETQ